MKKKLISLLIILVVMFAVLPSASADTNYLEAVVGDWVYNYIGSVDLGSYVYSANLPSGLYIAEESDEYCTNLYIAGTPAYPDDQLVNVTSTDGRVYTCRVVVVGKVGPDPVVYPFIDWVSSDFSCYQFSDSYVSVDVANANGWELTYNWYQNGNCEYIGDSRSYRVNTNTVGSVNYKCHVEAYNRPRGEYYDVGWTDFITVYVNGNSIENIRICSYPSKTQYNLGDYVNTDGLSIYANYSSGYQEVIYSGFEITPKKLNNVGDQKVLVGYAGWVTEFHVNVIDNVYVSKISIDTVPDKVNYLVGDTLNTAGLGIKVVYSNGGSEYIYNGFTVSPKNFDSVGTKTITVKYGGCTTSFTVSVDDGSEPTGIAIGSLPLKLQYTVGEELDTNGLLINVLTKNGGTQTVFPNDSRVKISPTTLTAEGKQKVTVVYTDASQFQCDFEVSVSAKPAPTAAPSAAPSSAPAAPSAAPAQKADGTSSVSPIIYVIAAVVGVVLIGLVVCVIVLQNRNKKLYDMNRKNRNNKDDD